MTTPTTTSEELLAKAREYLPPDKLPLVEKAHRFAMEAHAGQLRLSGEPFLEHPLKTALVLADLRLDAATLAAALLHDVVEDCGVTPADMRKRFGAEVASLVDGVTKLGKVSLPSPREGEPADDGGQAESLRKMLVAMAQDVRVILIKLADRLHNMMTVDALPPGRRRAMALETMELYAPLAHRLGMWELGWQLEDLAFRVLDTAGYERVAKLLATKRQAREQYVSQVAQRVKDELAKAGVVADVVGRPKHLYSIHQKIEKYAALGREFSEIYDLLAVRVIVNAVPDCYQALGLIHSLWRPVPGQFDDYIANPKENMYQSLHTTVMLGGNPLEIQIRTWDMHRVAEYGIAAHWRYKEGAEKDVQFDGRMAWLREIMESHQQAGATDEFLESIRTDILPDQVFVFTPKGEVKELPAGATPVDFAYRIHTELGQRCIGAKVNGRLVSLDYELENGDTVEIIAAKKERGPSLDWLNPHLGYVKTSSARQKIRQWFKKQERAESLQRGRELLEKELRRLGGDAPSLADLAKLFHHQEVDDFLVALGSGSIGVAQVAAKLAVAPSQPLFPESAPVGKTPSGGLRVLGVGDLLTNLAPCCNPVPGDDIVGFVTRSKGVTVHVLSCPNVHHTDEKERLVKVDWGQTHELFPVALRVEAWDRVGLLRDVTTVVSQEKVNISAVTMEEHSDATISIFITLQTTGIAQLSRLYAKLEGVRGVTSVGRDPEAGRRAAGRPEVSGINRR